MWPYRTSHRLEMFISAHRVDFYIKDVTWLILCQTLNSLDVTTEQKCFVV